MRHRTVSFAQSAQALNLTVLSKQDLVRDSFRLRGFPSQYDSEVGKLAMKNAHNQRGPTHEVAVFPREVEHESIHCDSVYSASEKGPQDLHGWASAAPTWANRQEIHPAGPETQAFAHLLAEAGQKQTSNSDESSKSCRLQTTFACVKTWTSLLCIWLSLPNSVCTPGNNIHLGGQAGRANSCKKTLIAGSLYHALSEMGWGTIHHEDGLDVWPR